MRRKGIVAIFTVVALLVVAALTVFFASSFNDKNYIVTVTRVERVNDDTDSKYLIFCEEEDGDVIVFENADKWVRGKFDSSNMYAKIKEGHKYKFTVVGWRIPIFSTYQNIIKMEEVE